MLDMYPVYLESGGEAREGAGASEQPGGRGGTLCGGGVQSREVQQHDLHVQSSQDRHLHQAQT